MDKDKLLRLIKSKEGTKLDFKLQLPLSTESNKKELTKDAIAIANSPGGRGHLIIGVEDKTKRIVGVNPEEYPEEKIQQILLNRCEPPISIRVEDFDVEDKKLVVITIFKSHNRPHQMRQTGAFYVRRGSTTDYARRDEIAVMLQHGGLFYDEMVPVYNSDLSHLDQDKINVYLKKIIGTTYQEGQEGLLAEVGILFYEQEDNHYYPTVGSLLLFGKRPQTLLPHTALRVIYHDANGDRMQETLYGTLVELLDQALDRFAHLTQGVAYPIEGVEEALANALIHRDYFVTSREIVLYIGANTVEISNPGAILDRDPLNNVINTSNPKRRNIWLYHQLMIIDDKQRFTKYGMGLAKIRRTVLKHGGVKFANLRKQNIFKVLLPGLKQIK